MADPSSGAGPYYCCGEMREVHLLTNIWLGDHDPAKPLLIAFLCDYCGVWRDALCWGDPDRAFVAGYMQKLLALRFSGAEVAGLAAQGAVLRPALRLVHSRDPESPARPATAPAAAGPGPDDSRDPSPSA